MHSRGDIKEVLIIKGQIYAILKDKNTVEIYNNTELKHTLTLDGYEFSEFLCSTFDQGDNKDKPYLD